MAPGAVERRHLQRPQPLPVRMTGGEGIELGDHAVVVAESELGLDPLFLAGEAQVLEPAALGLGERLAELRERRAAPQCQRPPERLGGRLRIAARERPAPLARQPLEALGVDRLRSRVQDVPRRAGLERPLREHLAQPGDVDLHHLGRAVGQLLAPQVVQQPLDRDGAPGVEQQAGEQRPLLARPEIERGAAVARLQRA